jgi:hypothetical protein
VKVERKEDKIIVCPFGNRILRKPGQSHVAHEKQKYCTNRCRGKYSKPAPARRGFEIEVPADKHRTRVGAGFFNYLSSRTEW